MPDSDSTGIIWAMGGRNSSQVAHAFLSGSAFEKGEAVCGRDLKPRLILPEWDMNDPEMVEHTCPYCRGRINLLHIKSKR